MDKLGDEVPVSDDSEPTATETERRADTLPETSSSPVEAQPDPNQVASTASTTGATNSLSFRGPLRYEVDTSSPQLSAGRRFSIFVRITNPYDVPVTIEKVECSLPAEFRDEGQVGVLGRIKQYFMQVFNQELESGPDADRGGDARGTSINVVGESISAHPPKGGSDEDPKVVLQPGNTALRRFTISTWQRNMFAPGSYTLHFQCQYQMEGILNTDATKQPFALRAPISAMIWGAFWGAVAGVILRFLNAPDSDPIKLFGPHYFPYGLLSALVAGLVVAAVLVVAFARKKDVQPFISIEDFYGGFFVGFVAGFEGISILKSVLPTGIPPVH